MKSSNLTQRPILYWRRGVPPREAEEVLTGDFKVVIWDEPSGGWVYADSRYRYNFNEFSRWILTEDMDKIPDEDEVSNLHHM